MLKNYLLSALRNLARQKLYAFINVLGLAIGLCVFILIMLFVDREYSYDRDWQNAERIHWLINEFKINSSTSFKNTYVPYPALSAVRAYFPDAIESAARVMRRGDVIHAGENRFEGSFILAEPEFLDIFDFEVLAGSLEATFSAPGRIALSESTATRYFGGSNPLGETLTLEVNGQGLFDYQVSAVFRNPGETSLRLPPLGLLEESAMPEMAAAFEDWTGPARAMSFFLLRDGADVEAMNRRLVDFVDQVMPKDSRRVLGENERVSDYNSYTFQRLADAHFDGSLPVPSGDEAKVLTFALVGLLVLVMGGANFVILATAKAEDRKREVGVRKVLGANKGQLLLQFLGESVIHALAALLLAILLVFLGLPFFEGLIGVGVDLAFDLLNPLTPALLLLLALSLGVAAGAYPALVMADFQPVAALKAGASRMGSTRISLCGVLAGFQFAIAVALIVATLVLYLQLSFMRNLDLGYEPERLFVIPLNVQEMRSQSTPLVNAFRALPGVSEVAISTRAPLNRGLGFLTAGAYTWERSGMEADYQAFWVGEALFETYGMKLLAGRFFDLSRDFLRQNPPSGQEEETLEQRLTRLLVNRKLTESLGFASPQAAVGELIHTERTDQEGETRQVPAEIIGVVEDSRFISLREPTINEVYLLRTGNPTAITVKYQESVTASIQETLESAWKSVLGDDTPFQGSFVEQSLATVFVQEENEGKLLMAFALLSIFVACMGLYGLAAYTMKKSVKEVGVRKVLGAGSGNLLLLFLWRFSRPVLLANLVAWPLAVWAMLRWLQRFPEQIDYFLLAPVCLAAAGLSLLIAWVTVSMTTAKAACAEPVRSLRYE